MLKFKLSFFKLLNVILIVAYCIVEIKKNLKIYEGYNKTNIKMKTSNPGPKYTKCRHGQVVPLPPVIPVLCHVGLGSGRSSVYPVLTPRTYVTPVFGV